MSALRAPQIRALVEQQALQLSLFDEQNLAEIVSQDYPGERLVACYNPLLAEERARKREPLPAPTEAGLERVAREAARRTREPLGAAELGRKVGRVPARHKMGKHFEWEVEHGQLVYRRNAEGMEAEARLDGAYGGAAVVAREVGGPLLPGASAALAAMARGRALPALEAQPLRAPLRAACGRRTGPSRWSPSTGRPRP